MNKLIKSIALISSIGFICGCGAKTSESITPTSIWEDPAKDMSDDDLVSLFKKTCRTTLNSSVKSYTYEARKLQTNYNTGSYYDNYFFKMNMVNYEDSIYGDYKFTQYSKGCFEPSLDFKTNGYTAIYHDDEYCYYGNQSDNSDAKIDGIAIIEYSPFIDTYGIWGHYEQFASKGAVTAYTNLNQIYKTSDGYYKKTESIERSDDGYVLSITTGAPAEGVYSEEEICYSAKFDRDLNLLQMDYDYLIWCGAKVEENAENPKTGVNRYDHITIKNIVLGAHEGANDFAFDLTKPTAINDERSHIVNIEQEGAVSNEKVIEILNNISAYTKGTKTTTMKSTYTNFIEYKSDGTAVGLGGAVETATFNAYNDYIMTIDDSLAFSDDPFNPTKSQIQYYKNKDNDLAFRQKVGGDIYAANIDKSTVAGSLHYYLDANAIYRDNSLLIFRSSNNLTSTTTSYSTVTYKNESTFVDGILTIDLTFINVPKTAYVNSVYKENKHIIFTFDKDFFCTSVYDKTYLQNPGDPECTTTTNYESVKGELTDFDGELLAPDWKE